MGLNDAGARMGLMRGTSLNAPWNKMPLARVFSL